MSERFAIMRCIYDGFYERSLGTNGGLNLAWAGKCGFVAAVTDEIDQHHEPMAALGHRYLYVRQPKLTGAETLEMQYKAGVNVGKQSAMREALSLATKRFFARLTIPTCPERHPDLDRLYALARLVTLARSHVGRSTGGIEYVNEPEAPMRLGGQLAQLYGGLRAIGVDTGWAERLVVRVGADSVPPARWRSLAALIARAPLTSEEVAGATGLVVDLADRALGDLAAHGLTARGADLRWTATAEALDEWHAAGVGL